MFLILILFVIYYRFAVLQQQEKQQKKTFTSYYYKKKKKTRKEKVTMITTTKICTLLGVSKYLKSFSRIVDINVRFTFFNCRKLTHDVFVSLQNLLAYCVVFRFGFGLGHSRCGGRWSQIFQRSQRVVFNCVHNRELV